MEIEPSRSWDGTVERLVGYYEPNSVRVRLEGSR